MGYHSGLNGEYNIPVEISEKKIHKFKKCCKEELPESALKIETYLKDDTIYFVLPSSYKPVKICFAEGEPSAPPRGNIYGGKGNQKLNVDFRSTGYHQDDNCVNISDSTNNAIKTSLSPSAFETGYYYTDNSININDCIEGSGGSGATDAIYSMIDDGVYNPNLKYQAGPSSIQYDTINENLDAYGDAIKNLYKEINKALGTYRDYLE